MKRSKRLPILTAHAVTTSAKESALDGDDEVDMADLFSIGFGQ
jgi:hypothetical protein